MEHRDTTERDRPRTAQSFCVSKEDIQANGYDLSINRYKEIVHDEIEHVPPQQLIQELLEMEREIENGLRELEGMLK